MAYSVSWDETIPANHTTFASQPGHVRNTRIALRERFQLGGMYFPSTHDELAGEYSYVRMANQGSTPAAVAGKWMLHVTASGLFIVSPAGTVIQLTDTTGISGSSFVTGDLILSTVATAHSGWTNVSATYADKFIRINATALSTGGADTHTHAAGSYAGPSHTHDVPIGADGSDLFWVQHTGAGGSFSVDRQLSQSSVSTTKAKMRTDAGGTGAVTGTSASGDNIPAYVTVTVFKKD